MEEVLVIPAELVLECRDQADVLMDAALKHYRFMARDAAEHDERWKQVIPYMYVHFNGAYLLVQRLAAQSEKRLHGKWSLGIGGHINPVDGAAGDNVILAGLKRELAEEVLLQPAGPPVFKGIINDESTAVGRVHVGFVYALECNSPAFTIQETDKMHGEWAGAEVIAARYESLESWSQMVFDRYLHPGCAPGLFPV
jgi:predicted NUDIX family phosphoesterase